MPRKHFLILGLIFLLVCPSFLQTMHSVEAPIPDYTIDGDTVYVDDANVYIAIYPHSTSGGWVYLNLTSKAYEGEVDVVFGFNGSVAQPRKADWYDPYDVVEELSYRIEDRYFDNTTYYKYNYTAESVSAPEAYNGTLFLWTKIGSRFENETVLDDWLFIYSWGFDVANINTRSVYWSEVHHFEWRSIANENFQKINYEYDGLNTWYYGTFNIQKDREYHIRVLLDVKPVIGEFNGTKYGVALKPADETFGEAIGNGHLYYLDPWLSGGWDQRVKITIDSGDIDAVLTDFPLLIYLSASSGINNDDVSFIFDELTAVANRKKIAVTLGEDTQLYVEIERWDDGSEKAWLWVKVAGASIPSGADTDLYLYFDVDHADNDAFVGDPNDVVAENVWDSNFKFVSHMKDDPDNTHVRDSTDQDNDGTKAAANNPQRLFDSIIADSQDFVDTDSAYIDLGVNPTFGANDFTIEAWVNLDAVGKNQLLFDNRDANDDGIRILFTDGDTIFCSLNGADVSTAYAFTTLKHVLFSADVSGNGVIYLDGVAIETDDISGGGAVAVTETTKIGRNAYDALQYLDGILDEFRISVGIARSAAYAKATYESGRDDLLDFGTEETKVPPTITSATIPDRDDPDNMYAMKAYYTFVVVVNDGDGASDIATVSLRLLNGATVVGEFKAYDLDSTPAWSIVSNSTEFDLDAANSVWGEAGDVGTATFKIRAEWDVTQYDDLELSVFVADTSNATAGWTVKQSNYFDIITRLVTSNLAASDPRVDVSTGASTISGNVNYATTLGGDTASAKYPPDAQFTAVHAHAADHSSLGNDAAIVNGAFSFAATMPPAVGSNTLHIYLDLVPDYTDADAPDGDTVAVIGDQIEIVSVAFPDSRININTVTEVRYVLRWDFDDVEFGAGQAIVGFTWDAGNSWWDKAVTSPTPAGADLYDENDLGAITDNTHGISVVEDDAGTNLIGDSIFFKTATFEVLDNHINKSDTGTWYVELLYEYDSAEVEAGSVTLNVGVMAWDAVDGRWEYTNAPGAVVDVTRNIASLSGSLHGITTINGTVTGDSETIEFDELVFFTGTTLSTLDGRINFDGTGTWYAYLMLANNNLNITAGTITLNTGAMSWDAGDSRWEYTNAPGAVVGVARNIASVTGLTGGITEINAAVTGNSETIIFDRIKILTLGADTITPAAGATAELFATAELEFDNHVLGAGDSLNLESTVFAYNGTHWIADVTEAAPAINTYNEFTSGTEVTYTITVGNINGQTVTVTWGTIPSISSATITDLDDTDNMYAMNGYYTFQINVDDPDGPTDITNVSIRIIDGGSILGEFKGATLNVVPAYSIVSNATEFDLDSGGSSWAVGATGVLTLSIRAEWDVGQAADLELNVTVVDTVGKTTSWTEMRLNYFDIITRLVTSGISTNVTYVDLSGGVQVTGTVYYATTVAGDIPSSVYPLDAQFTHVAVHNVTHDQEGTDTTIVNGAFSVDFNVPGTKGTFVYHIYLNLIADYTDADAPDGDTFTLYVIDVILLYSFDDETGSTVTDSVGSNDGTLTGATRTGSGLYGKGISFDGTDDYIVTPQSAALNLTSEVALLAWVKTSDAGVQGLIYKTGAYGLTIISNYAIRFTINSTVLETLPGVFSSDTWTHIAGVYNTSHMLIYINGVLNTSSAVTGSIAINQNDLFIGNVTTFFLSGTVDEVEILDYSPPLAYIVGFMWDPIAAFPYNLQGTITDMDATNWVFAGDSYNFEGVYVRQNASFPLDTARMRFTDGASWTTMTYDIVSDIWTLSSSGAYLIGQTNVTSGNEWTITWELYIRDTIFDALDVDLSMYVNDTLANSDGWEVVASAYFNIYNQGGLSEFDSSGDGISVAGEGVFGLAAQNSSLSGGSWAYANITWRKFQHVNFLVHLWQSTAYNTSNFYWECPTEHNNTGYVEYGVDYWHDGSWVAGWKVRLVIEDGMAGGFGGSADQAWVLINASWYNRGDYVKSDLFYAYYEAINATDTTTQFAIYVDLWVGIEGGSSTVGGRVNAEYFGMNETGWGPWANWRPMRGLEDESVFVDDLLDSGSAVIGATELEMFSVWALINKTSPDAGEPDCDSHQWGLVDYSGPYWRTLPPTDIMIGISMPIPAPTITPGETSTGFFSAFITAMIEGITKPIVAALGGGASALFFLIAGIIDSAFAYFGISGFIVAITAMITSYGSYLLESMTNMVLLVVQIFRIITLSAGTAISWLTRMISFILNMGGIVLSIIDGTSTQIAGLSDLWAMMNFSTWVDFIPVISFVYWMDAVDKRARRLGGGWMSIFIGDLQMISFVLSFFVDWMTRIIEFVIGRVQWLINAIRLT